MRDSNLTPLAKCILFDLILYAGVFGEPYPSQIKLAGDQGCSDRQVRRALIELSEKGWITSWKRRGYSMSNKYSVIEDMYVRNEESIRTSTSSHSGHTVPVQIGHPRPPKVSHEESQLSSSHIQQLFERTSKTKATIPDRRRLNELCGEYTEAWVEDAINVAANRNLPYLKVGLISEILEDWRKDGKPEPKPIFQPCGKNGCENGNIFHPERYTYSICECREQFDKELKEWKEKWGESQ